MPAPPVRCDCVGRGRAREEKSTSREMMPAWVANLVEDADAAPEFGVRDLPAQNDTGGIIA